MDTIKNIAGVFPVTLGGTERQVKVTFGLVERLETQVLQRPLCDLLNDAAIGRFKISDIVRVIHEGLVNNGDKRLTYDQVGEEIVATGAQHFANAYVDMLTYAVTGGVPADGNAASSKKS